MTTTNVSKKPLEIPLNKRDIKLPLSSAPNVEQPQNLSDLFNDVVVKNSSAQEGVSFPKEHWGKVGFSVPGVEPRVFSASTKSSLNDDDEKALTEREQAIKKKVEFLEQVYRGTSKEYALSDAVKKVLREIGEQLLDKGEDYGVGSTLREVAKTLYSRWTVEPQFQNNKPFILLWNVLEEARTGNMLKSQYPGAGDFFKPVYEEDFLKAEAIARQQEQIVDVIQKEKKVSREEAVKIAQESGFINPLPKHIQYVMAILYEFFSGKKIDWNNPSERPSWVASKETIEALNTTASDYREVMRLKESLFGKDYPEEKVQKQAQDAYQIIRDKIWPVYKKLVEQDQEELGQQLDEGQGQDSQKTSGSQNSSNSQQSSSSQGASGSEESDSEESDDSQSSSGSRSSSGSQSSSGSRSSSGSQSSSGKESSNKPEQEKSSEGSDSGESEEASGSQQTGESQESQGEEAAGKQGRKEPSQASQNSAKEIVDEIDERLSRSLETKDESSRRGGDGKGKQGSKASQGQQSQQGNQGNQASQGQQSQQGKDAQTSESAEGEAEGAEGAEGSQDSQGAEGAEGSEGAEGASDSEGAEGAEGNSQSQSASRSPSNGRSTSNIEEKSLEDLMRLKAMAEAAAMSQLTPYQRYYSEVAQASEELAGILSNIFEKNAKPRFSPPQEDPTGVVDMQAVVQYAAKAARGEIIQNPAIWIQKDEPNVRDHGVVFVLDLSGSMSGEKKEEAIKAWIMAAEALEKNRVPWSLIVFSDDHKILKDFDDNWDDQRRENTLAQILAFRQGGTNDADAVKPAIKMLEAKNPNGARLILPITDGEGKEQEMRKLVEEAERKGISVIGVGIDSAMEYIKRVYIYNAFAITLASLPSVLGTAIEERFKAVYAR
jgi:uncharacterized protein YegL